MEQILAPFAVETEIYGGEVMTLVSHWKPSAIEFCDTAEKIMACIGEGYRLCVEPEDLGGSCFMDEGFRYIGQDRPRIMVARKAAEEIVASGQLRKMSDEEVRAHVMVSPINRAFYLAVV